MVMYILNDGSEGFISGKLAITENKGFVIIECMVGTIFAIEMSPFSHKINDPVAKCS